MCPGILGHGCGVVVFGCVWACLGMFGHGWACVGVFGRVWACLVVFSNPGSSWAVVPLGMLFLGVCRRGRPEGYTSGVMLGYAWVYLSVSRYVWVCLVMFGRV